MNGLIKINITGNCGAFVELTGGHAYRKWEGQVRHKTNMALVSLPPQN